MTILNHQLYTLDIPFNNNNKAKLILTLLLILLNTLLYNTKTLAAVDHKNFHLSSYMDQISDNQEEKAGIVNIIKKHKSGAFLDIGSGRDTISYIINNLPMQDLNNVKIIAADLEGKTLAEIAKRYPEMYFNLDRRSNINLSLMKMDATEMHQIKDSSIKAINASAVLHEINSYVPHKTPIDRFFGESIRILEKDGFLVYRDPTLQSKPEEVNSLVIKNDFAKKFVVIFLPKFLDKSFTEITDMYGNSIKPDFHYQDRLTVTLYLIGEGNSTKLDYQDFFNMPLNSIDYNKEIIIKAPRRLLSEIQRHYLLFVKNVYPIAFIDDKHINMFNKIAQAIPNRAKKTVNSFAQKLNINLNKRLNQIELYKLTAERKKINNLINKGITITTLSSIKLKSLQKFLESRGTTTNLYKLLPENGGIWLDGKLFIILYNKLQNEIVSANLPIESMRWLIREGEEFYFYFTLEELLNYLEKFCEFYLKNTNKEGYILIPASKEDVKYSTREIYTDILERDMVQLDAGLLKQEFITSKTIITFQLKKATK